MSGVLKQGVMITSGLQNWQIIQQVKGKADIKLAGYWFIEALPEGAEIKITARVVHEYTGEVIKPWKLCDKYGVNWSVCLNDIPAGGLYRVETCIDYTGSNGLSITRGDMIHHVGVGDIFVIAGQSNASGRAKDPVEDPPELGVHVMRNSGRWDLASHPLNETTNSIYDAHFETANPSHSPYLAFGKLIKAKIGIPIGLIQTSLGGSGLWQWNPEQEGTLYHNMINIIKNNSSNGVKGILWYQGCADAFENYGDTYYERFRHMVNRTRQDICQPELPFFTVQLNRCTLPATQEQDKSWGMVREAQRRAAHELENVYVVPANDLKLYDFIHNCASANLMVAERTARCVLDVLYDKPHVWKAPEVIRAVKSEKNKVLLYFSNITHWINPFEVPAPMLPFTVEDEIGLIGVAAYEIVGTDSMLLTFDRELSENAKLHGAWQMNPPFLIPFDCANLPMLSFYGLKIEEEEG